MAQASQRKSLNYHTLGDFLNVLPSGEGCHFLRLSESPLVRVSQLFANTTDSAMPLCIRDSFRFPFTCISHLFK